MSEKTSESLDHYKNNPFTEEENDLLSSGVLSFIPTIKLSWVLLRRDFARGFAIPWAMHFILGIVMMLAILVVVFFTAILFSIFISLSDGGLESLGFGAFFVGIFTVLIIKVLILLYIFASFYITFRQQYILNHTEYESILKTPDITGFGKRILKAVAANLIIYTPITLVVLFLILVGAGTIALSVSSDNSLLIGFGVVLILLGLAVSLANLFIAGFVWMYEQLIIQENLGVVESLKTSYRIMKNYFWQNALRWLIFALIFFFPPLIVSFFQEILTEIMPEDLYVIVIFLSLFGTLFNFIWGLLSWFFGSAFYYISFYNIRKLYSETKEKV